MEYLYILVTREPSSSYHDEILMNTCKSESDALDQIGNMGMDRKLDKVFKVDQFGRVTHYDVVFDGRLKLKEVKE